MLILSNCKSLFSSNNKLCVTLLVFEFNKYINLNTNKPNGVLLFFFI